MQNFDRLGEGGVQSIVHRAINWNAPCDGPVGVERSCVMRERACKDLLLLFAGTLRQNDQAALQGGFPKRCVRISRIVVAALLGVGPRAPAEINDEWMFELADYATFSANGRQGRTPSARPGNAGTRNVSNTPTLVVHPPRSNIAGKISSEIAVVECI
jgi:hypothetical protein